MKVALASVISASTLTLVQAKENETIIFYLHSADGKVIASKSYIITKGNNQLTWNLQQLAGSLSAAGETDGGNS